MSDSAVPYLKAEKEKKINLNPKRRNSSIIKKLSEFFKGNPGSPSAKRKTILKNNGGERGNKKIKGKGTKPDYAKHQSSDLSDEETEEKTSMYEPSSEASASSDQAQATYSSNDADATLSSTVNQACWSKKKRPHVTVSVKRSKLHYKRHRTKSRASASTLRSVSTMRSQEASYCNCDRKKHCQCSISSVTTSSRKRQRTCRKKTVSLSDSNVRSKRRRKTEKKIQSRTCFGADIPQSASNSSLTSVSYMSETEKKKSKVHKVRETCSDSEAVSCCKCNNEVHPDVSICACPKPVIQTSTSDSEGYKSERTWLKRGKCLKTCFLSQRYASNERSSKSMCKCYSENLVQAKAFRRAAFWPYPPYIQYPQHQLPQSFYNLPLGPEFNQYSPQRIAHSGANLGQQTCNLQHQITNKSGLESTPYVVECVASKDAAPCKQTEKLSMHSRDVIKSQAQLTRADSPIPYSTPNSEMDLACYRAKSRVFVNFSNAQLGPSSDLLLGTDTIDLTTLNPKLPISTQSVKLDNSNSRAEVNLKDEVMTLKSVQLDYPSPNNTFPISNPFTTLTPALQVPVSIHPEGLDRSISDSNSSLKNDAVTLKSIQIDFSCLNDGHPDHFASSKVHDPVEATEEKDQNSYSLFATDRLCETTVNCEIYNVESQVDLQMSFDASAQNMCAFCSNNPAENEAATSLCRYCSSFQNEDEYQAVPKDQFDADLTLSAGAAKKKHTCGERESENKENSRMLDHVYAKMFNGLPTDTAKAACPDIMIKDSSYPETLEDNHVVSTSENTSTEDANYDISEVEANFSSTSHPAISTGLFSEISVASVELMCRMCSTRPPAPHSREIVCTECSIERLDEVGEIADTCRKALIGFCSANVESPLFLAHTYALKEPSETNSVHTEKEAPETQIICAKRDSIPSVNDNLSAAPSICPTNLFDNGVTTVTQQSNLMRLPISDDCSSLGSFTLPHSSTDTEVEVNEYSPRKAELEAAMDDSEVSTCKPICCSVRCDIITLSKGKPFVEANPNETENKLKYDGSTHRNCRSFCSRENSPQNSIKDETTISEMAGFNSHHSQSRLSLFSRNSQNQGLWNSFISNGLAGSRKSSDTIGPGTSRENNKTKGKLFSNVQRS